MDVDAEAFRIYNLLICHTDKVIPDDTEIWLRKSEMQVNTQKSQVGHLFGVYF